jgi:hypothetical protein
MHEQDLLSKEQLADYDNYLLTKQQLGEKLGLTPRGIEQMMRRRQIPVVRISRRCVRFSLPRVLKSLAKFELKEVG